LRLLDLGTGTGCLLLTLLKEYPNATGMAVDRSEKALAVAAQNAARHGLEGRVTFIESNWCEKVQGRFDIVISNPPYIASGTIAVLSPEVAQFEPLAALDGGADGLDAYRAIAAQLESVLAPGGIAALELGS